MRKLIPIAAMALAVSIALVGCSQASPSATATPLSKDMKATLNIWTYDQQATGKRDVDVQAEAFKALYPNVTVNVTYVPQDQMANKIIASATSKSGPDIIWYNPAYTANFASAGVIANFDKEWASYADAKQYPASVLQKSGKSVYGIQSYVNLNALWYNKTILDSLNLKVPSTLDDLQTDLAAIKSGSADTGLQISGTPGIEGEWISKPFFTGYGIDSYKNYGNSRVKDMFSQLSGWVDKGYIDKGTLGLSQADGVQKFIGGNVGFYVGGNWQLSLAKNVSFKWGVVGMPKGPNGPGTVYLGGQGEAIGAFTTNKALSWEFLKDTWLTKDFGSARLALGSIPTRKDVLPSDVDPNIKAYAAALAAGEPLSSDTASTLAVGNLWSGVMTGQTDPASGAAQAAQIAKGAK